MAAARVDNPLATRGSRRAGCSPALSWRVSVGLFALLTTIRFASGQYHTYPQIEAELQTAEANFGAICKRYSLGQTVQGRTMWALRISDNVDTEEDEPEVKLISTMHGDEVTGVELCLNLIADLTQDYGTDPRLTNIVNSVELWIVPCMNPDGFVAVQRGNIHGADLNRDFPDPFTSPNNDTIGREPETANIMNWSFGRSFTLAANYHGGSLVVNYPFDNNASGSSVYTASPDDDLFIWISEQYSQYNAPMWGSASFFHGITNGADWYAISGGMQDWSYRYLGTNEVTIEVSVNKIPPASQIPTFWAQNRESMLAYIETALVGVRGLVTDGRTGGPLAASVAVVGRDHLVYTDPDVGDYHRMLLPGTYDLRYEAPSYDARVLPGVSVPSGTTAQRDVSLWNTLVAYPNGGETLPAGQAAGIAWTGDPTRAFQVQITANADDLVTMTDGFESGSLGAAYTTGGNAVWNVASDDASAGTYSARSGTITHNQTTWLSRTVEADHVRFDYRVSSETGYDFFNFLVDGDRKVHASGTASGWLVYDATMTPGTHTLRWEYTKDVSLSVGSDAAWIDEVQITGDQTLWTDVVSLSPVGATAAVWTPAIQGTSYRVRVRSHDGAGGYGAWDASDALFAVGAPADIPTVSAWGLAAMVFLLLAAGGVIVGRSRSMVRRVSAGPAESAGPDQIHGRRSHE